MVVSVVDDRQLGLALGAVDYLVKPVSRELLLESLGRLTFTTKVRTRTVTALVIDPDPEAHGRYRELLEPDGFRVIAETDGHDRPAARDRRATGPHRARRDADRTSTASSSPATLRHDPQTSAIPIWLTTPGTLAPDAKARLNGNVQGVLERGDDALAALRSWLTNGHAQARRRCAHAVPPTQLAAPGEARPPAMSGDLLLAVEDEPRNAALLEAILGRAGYQLHVAGDLASAREWLATETPALVLLDRHLPDGDGLELIATIRGAEPAARRADPARERERPAARPVGRDGRRLRRLPRQARAGQAADRRGQPPARSGVTVAGQLTAAQAARNPGETGRLAAARGAIEHRACGSRVGRLGRW